MSQGNEIKGQACVFHIAINFEKLPADATTEQKIDSWRRSLRAAADSMTGDSWGDVVRIKQGTEIPESATCIDLETSIPRVSALKEEFSRQAQCKGGKIIVGKLQAKRNGFLSTAWLGKADWDISEIRPGKKIVLTGLDFDEGLSKEDTRKAIIDYLSVKESLSQITESESRDAVRQGLTTLADSLTVKNWRNMTGKPKKPDSRQDTTAPGYNPVPFLPSAI